MLLQGAKFDDSKYYKRNVENLSASFDIIQYESGGHQSSEHDLISNANFSRNQYSHHFPVVKNIKSMNINNVLMLILPCGKVLLKFLKVRFLIYKIKIHNKMLLHGANFDPTKFNERMVENLSESFDVIQYESGGVRTYKCPFCPYKTQHHERRQKCNMTKSKF
ncbi:hypothetical protein Avbf_10423 [Armadillidium vulgare]|nr:hypothetical protein Avbf_10423 [Armadillidium vulgare]